MERIKTPMIAAEVGVFKGGNALRMLMMNITKLSLIDPYSALAYLRRDYIQKELDEAMKIMLERLTPFINNNRVEFIRKTSVEAAKDFPDGHFDFVYIDGDHSYECCKEDMEAWYPKIKKGGVLCGHDFVTISVAQACREFAESKGLKLIFWVDPKDYKPITDANPTPDGDKDWVMEKK
jgi:predicted O-methyltransferase YrrM